jgi:hypothetical protein
LKGRSLNNKCPQQERWPIGLKRNSLMPDQRLLPGINYRSREKYIKRQSADKKTAGNARCFSARSDDQDS